MNLTCFTNYQMMIKGKVSIDGKGLNNQEIQFVNRANKEIIGFTITDNSGNFRFSADKGIKTIDILFKIKTENLISVYYMPFTDQEVMNLNVNLKNYYDLILHIDSNEGWPPELNIFIDPVTVEDVPDYLTENFKMQSKNVMSSYFYRKPFKERTINLKLRKGTYNIGGEYILYDSMLDSSNYIVKSAVILSKNKNLEGNIYNGFRLNFQGNSEIKLNLAKYRD